MSDIPSFPYKDIWEERQIRSVANLTRKDGEDFLKLAPAETEVTIFPLDKTNDVLNALRDGKFNGSVVIQIA